MSGVLFGLDGEQAHLTEQPAGQESQTSVAGKAARTHAGVDDRDGDALSSCRRQEAGPQFALGQHHQVGPNPAESPAHGPGEVERPGEDCQVGKVFAGLGQAGVGRRGDDAFPLRVPSPEAGHDLPQQVNFPDADAMEPGTGSASTTQDCRAGQPVPQSAALLPSGQHTGQNPGRKNEQAQQVGQVQ